MQSLLSSKNHHHQQTIKCLQNLNQKTALETLHPPRTDATMKISSKCTKNVTFCVAVREKTGDHFQQITINPEGIFGSK